MQHAFDAASGFAGYSGKESWTRTALYEIVLWELNRFPGIDDALFMERGKTAEIPPEDFRSVKETLCRLLACNHVGITMAMAILRFINPETFQTMDRTLYQIDKASGRKLE